MKVQKTAHETLESSLLETPASDHLFFLAARGLRRIHGRGDGFLGYSPEEMFWKDVLELVHEEDLFRARSLISDAIESPGASLAADVRLRDGSGEWRAAEFIVRNVLEAPDDTGLVVANVRAAQEAPGKDGCPRKAPPSHPRF